MDLRLFDTATGIVRPLPQREAGKVSMYVCGPTVYDFPHIGHGRSVLVYDILRRYLEGRGIDVHHVANVTDLEDKIIARATREGVSTEEITTKWEAEWWSEMDRLGVLRPHDTPHATEYVEQMVELIGRLLEADIAYETESSIYFDATKVEGYGLLARQSLESLRAGARIDVGEEKRSSVDFVLWKKEASPGTPNAPTWDSPWGPGRPGWHTECVVMSLDLLGEGFDIHGGGLDLCFPHHENERAQAVALGRTFARQWVHNGFVEVAGEKMSKSLGNFRTLSDLLEEHDPRAYRMLVLGAHYRAPIEVTSETMTSAEAALGRLDDFARRFPEVPDTVADESLISAFCERMDDDLDSPGALASVFRAVREANTDADSGDAGTAATKAAAVRRMLAMVGLPLKEIDEIDEVAADLVQRRDAARAAKNWAEADSLRNSLQERGWTVEDTPAGTSIHR